MGFANSVIGGASALIRAAIKSPNFLTGSAGWQIAKDGTAEFNSLALRGTFSGTNFIINASGMFIYNGAPAKGTLILAIAETTGTDSFGNSYGQGFNVGVWSASTGGQLQHFGIDNNGKVYVASPTGVTVTFIDSSTGAVLTYNASGLAAGNLIASVSPVSGTDTAGNKYLEGVTSYGGGTATQLDQGAVAMYTGSLAAGWTAKAQMFISAGGVIELIPASGQGVITSNNTLDNGAGGATFNGNVVVGGASLTVGNGGTANIVLSPKMGIPPNRTQVDAGTATAAQICGFLSTLFAEMEGRGLFT